jgi:hypothetical protein
VLRTVASESSSAATSDDSMRGSRCPEAQRRDNSSAARCRANGERSLRDSIKLNNRVSFETGGPCPSSSRPAYPRRFRYSLSFALNVRRPFTHQAPPTTASAIKMMRDILILDCGLRIRVARDPRTKICVCKILYCIQSAIRIPQSVWVPVLAAFLLIITARLESVIRPEDRGPDRWSGL